ncbi:MAG: histidine kinase [Chitinophagaceae bacterium]
MKKIITLLLLVAFTINAAYAQTVEERLAHGAGKRQVWFVLSQVDPHGFLRQNAMYTTDIAHFDEIFRLLGNKDPLPGQPYEIKPKTPVIMGVELAHKGGDAWAGETGSYTQSFSTYNAGDTSAASFFALGISANNYRDYKYHVVLNDSIELVPWQPVHLELKYKSPKPYADLGTYHYPGKQILVEVVNTKNYSIRDGIIVDWKSFFKPVIKQVSLSRPKEYFNLRYKPKSAGYVSKFDENTNLPLDLRMIKDSVERITIEFEKHPAQPLYIALIADKNGKKDTTVLDWWMEENWYYIENKHFSEPGSYEIIICRRGYDEKADFYKDYLLHLPFTVYQPAVLDKTISLRQLLPYLLAIVGIIAILFAWYYVYNRRRLQKAQQQKELKQVQLQSVRSQLNPHFLFNALSSIQGLVHKKDVDAAGDYLARFAGITRTILNTSEDELVSLEDELDMLDNYLQMEQLRFPFQYSINTKAVNIANTEIPVMLLQPFAENAVKHGVSGMQGEGRIIINIEADQQSLKMQVQDNGKGFSPDNYQPGLGLKLSQKRIELLNEIYGTATVSLTIEHADPGTIVTITLKNWLS